jgi:thiol-disulfide isomerase/thioredoxin
MDKTIKIAGGLFAVIILCAALVLMYPGISTGQTPQASIRQSGNLTVYFFYGEECPHCHNVMPFMQSLQQKYPEVNILYLEIWHNQTNQRISTTLNRELKVSRYGVPEVIVGDVVLDGEKEIPEKLEQAIIDQLKKNY